jgi:hypothetical protein
MAAGDVGLVAELVRTLFAWATGPEGWEKMSLEGKINVIHAGIKVAVAKNDINAVDLLFDQFRELQKRTGT